MDNAQRLAFAPTPPFTAVGGHAGDFHAGPLCASGLATIEKVTLVTEVLNYFQIKIVQRERLDVLARHTPDVVAIRVAAGFEEVWSASQASHSGATMPEVPSSRWIDFHRANAALLHDVLTPYMEMWARGGQDEALETKSWRIRMVDLCSELRCPSVMDLKLGAIRHSPFTPPEKVRRMEAKEAGGLVRSQSLRICGAVHYLGADGATKDVYGKELGHSIATAYQLRKAIALFLSSHSPIRAALSDVAPPQLDADALQRIATCCDRVQELLHFFQSPTGQQCLEETAFVSASLLLVYDAMASPHAVPVKVTLIDLARSGPRVLNFAEEEIQFVAGLRNLALFLADPTAAVHVHNVG